MSLLTRWLKQVAPSSTPGLPDPREEVSLVEAKVTEAANRAVDSSLASRKRKRGDYNFYSDEMRAKIAKAAIENGVMKTSRSFSKELGRSISESTVRSIRDSFRKRQRQNPASPLTSLPKGQRGQPVLLGRELDIKVQQWIRKVRLNGGAINTRIVMAAAQGIVQNADRTRLQQYGGSIKITKSWAKSLLKRMNFVKRKGTKGVKHLPSDFDQIKSAFHERVHSVVAEHNIPSELIVNWDQTGVSLVPGGEWTLEERGTEQVTINGMDDKRQITVLLAISQAGFLLPPQVIYGGKTDRCHPAVTFPETWDVTHTEFHWSNEESMTRYVQEVIISYIQDQRSKLGVNENQRALCLFDVYKAHRSKEMHRILQRNNISVVYIPAACTDRLQPLDLAVNKEFKEELKNCFQSWYADRVTESLDQQENDTPNTSPAGANIDLRTSVIKPLHAKWLMKCHEIMSTRRDIVINGFVQAGLV